MYFGFCILKDDSSWSVERISLRLSHEISQVAISMTQTSWLCSLKQLKLQLLGLHWYVTLPSDFISLGNLCEWNPFQGFPWLSLSQGLLDSQEDLYILSPTVKAQFACKIAFFPFVFAAKQVLYLWSFGFRIILLRIRHKFPKLQRCK